MPQENVFKAVKYSGTFRGSISHRNEESGGNKDHTRSLHLRWPQAGTHSLVTVPWHFESQSVTMWSQIPFFF